MSDDIEKTPEEQAPAQVAEQAAPAAPAEETAPPPDAPEGWQPRNDGDPEQQAPLQEGDEVAWTAAGVGMLVQVEQRGGVDVGVVLAGRNWCWHPDRYFTSEVTEAPGVPIRLADLRRPSAEQPAAAAEADAENDRLHARVDELERANEELRARVEELEDELGQDEEEDDEDEDGKPVRRQLPPVKNFEGRIKRIKRFTRRAMGFAKDAACDIASVSTELIGPGARDHQLAYHNNDWDALSATLKNAKDNIESVVKDTKEAGKALKLVIDQSEHFLQQAIDVHYQDVLTGQRNGKQTTIDEAVGGRHKDSVKPAEPKHETQASPAAGEGAAPGEQAASAGGAPASEGGDAPAPAPGEQAAAPAEAPRLSEAQRVEGGKRGVTAQQLDAIDAALRADPKISQVQLSKVTGVERTKIQRILKAGE